MKKIITTVGTSLLTNYLEKHDDIKLYCKSIKNKSYSEYAKSTIQKAKQIDKRVEKIKKPLLNYAKNSDSSCAELTSIKKLQEKYKDIEVYLIATDTIESVLVCEILKEVLGKNIKFDKEKDIIQSLKIDKIENFTKGINNLIDRIFSLIVNDKKIVLKSDEVIFNITGGFKGVIPYFSTIAQIFDYKIIYTFEDKANSNELIEIKPLPIEIDRGLLELYYPYLDNPLLIENDIKERLVSLGLYDNNITPLGKIALLTVKNTPLSKDVFGHFVEYKVYEYFIQNLFDKKFQCECLDFEYTKVGHGVGLGRNLTDIDIMLQKENEIVWIEVKPISYLIDEFNKDKLLTQIRDKQLAKWSESNFKDEQLKKYILVVYFYDSTILNQVKIKEFQELFKNKNIDFDVCYFQIKLSKSDKKEETITSATYQTVMKDFSIKQLKRIDNV